MGAVAFGIAIRFVEMHCPVCGCIFAMNDDMRQRRQEDGKDFYCPNGHVQRYVETEVARIRKQLEAEQRSHGITKDSLEFARRQRERTEHRLRAVKGQVTKIKNRVANGVCPCCRRTFQNLGRHMKDMHPDFKEAT